MVYQHHISHCWFVTVRRRLSTVASPVHKTTSSAGGQTRTCRTDTVQGVDIDHLCNYGSVGQAHIHSFIHLFFFIYPLLPLWVTGELVLISTGHGVRDRVHPGHRTPDLNRVIWKGWCINTTWLKKNVDMFTAGKTSWSLRKRQMENPMNHRHNFSF